MRWTLTHMISLPKVLPKVLPKILHSLSNLHKVLPKVLHSLHKDLMQTWVMAWTKNLQVLLLHQRLLQLPLGHQRLLLLPQHLCMVLFESLPTEQVFTHGSLDLTKL